MDSRGMSLVKYLLFLFNLIFVISGIAVTAIGVMAMVPYKQYSTFMDSKFAAGPIILIVTGVVIFIVAFLGCCGAIAENNCMLVAYSSLLLTIFCIELAAGICGYVYLKNIEKNVEKVFSKSMDEYTTNIAIKNAWDALENDLECCGVNGPGDWTIKTLSIPKSCCGHSMGNAQCNETKAYRRGCWPGLKDQIERFALIIGGVGIGIAFVQLLGVILAYCLARSIRKQYESM